MDKIDNIDKVVNSMNLKLNDLEIKVKNIDTCVTDLENASLYVSDAYDKQLKDLKTAQEKSESLKKSCSTLNDTTQQMMSNQKALRNGSYCSFFNIT